MLKRLLAEPLKKEKRIRHINGTAPTSKPSVYYTTLAILSLPISV